jgi:DNA primase
MTNALSLATDTRTIKFLFLPQEHDPDTFVRERGAEAFAAEVQTAMTLSQFLLFGLNQAAHDGSAEARARQMHLAKPMLQSLPNGALRTHIIHALALQLSSTAADVADYCELATTNKRPQKAAREKTKRMPPPSMIERALDLLIAHPTVAKTAHSAVWTELPQHQALTSLIGLLQAQPDLSPAALQHQLDQTDYADWYQHLLQKHLREPAPMTEEDAQTAFDALERQLQRDTIDQRLKLLAQQISVDESVKVEYMQLLSRRAQMK